MMDGKKDSSLTRRPLDSPNVPTSVWARARDEYLRDATVEEKALLESSSLQKVQEDLERLDRAHQQYSVTRRLGERFKPLLTGLHMFGTALDVLAQTEPNALLIWGSIRLVLVLFERFVNVFDELADALAKLGGPLGRLEEYLRVYHSSVRFAEAVARVYAAYLDCMKYTRTFLRQGRDRSFVDRLKDATSKTKIWMTFESGLQAKIRNVRDLCDEAREEAQLAGAQVSQDFFQRQEDQARRQERKAIEEWLSPLQFLRRQSELLTIKDFTRAGAWLFETEAFRYWSIGEPQMLKCYGAPGAGKTVFSAIIADHLKHVFGHERVRVISLYLEHREAKNHTINNIFGSLLKQLLQLREFGTVPEDLKKMYEKALRLEMPNPDMSHVTKVLRREIQQYQRVYLLVDGLDQCQFREQLLDELGNLEQDRLSILITQRLIDGEVPDDTISCNVCLKTKVQVYLHCDLCLEGEFDVCKECVDEGEHCLDSRHVLAGPWSMEVDVDARAEDLRRYARAVVQKEAGIGSRPKDPRRHRAQSGKTTFGRQCLQDSTLIERIPEIIVENSEGRFLWAELYLGLLKTRSSPREIQELLDAPPSGLDAFYEDAMRRISNLDNPAARIIGLKTMYLLVTAHRPLSLDELLHALAVKPGESTFDQYDMRDMEFVLENTMGLITVDHDFGSVYMHLTLQRYLLKSGDRWYPDAEMEMARICLTYLSYDNVLPHTNDEIDEKKHEYPFMAYAATFWGAHVRNAMADPGVRASTVQLVTDQTRVEACVRVAWRTDRSVDSWDVRRGLHGIHVCAWFGLSSIIAAMEPSMIDVDLQEPTYEQTALMYACRKGHLEVVQELVRLGADLNLKSRRGRTAIFECVTNRNGEVLDLLMKEKGLQLDHIYWQDYDRTEMLVAADRGYHDIVAKLLDDPRVNVNARDRYGRSAIWMAIFKGSQRVVSEILRKRPDANVDLADSMGGRTPLILASMCNQADTIEVLLNHGAKAELVDLDGGGTALLRAVEAGSESAIKVLLDHQVDPTCRDENGRGLLHGACGRGWDNLMPVLLDQCHLDINLCDQNGMTPLHEAAQNDHSAAVRALIERGAERAVEDKWGRTPLEVAWLYSSEVVIYLLEQEYHVQRTFALDEENLPLWSNARSGRLNIIRRQVNKRRGDLDALTKYLVDAEPCSGYSALHQAVDTRQSNVLRYLLEDCGTKPDPVNRHQRTPLHLAANSGNLQAVRILLEHDANPCALDKWGVTPLYLAQFNQHYEIAVILIEKDDDAIDVKINVQRLFFEAIKLGRVDAVNILLARGADILLSDKRGWTGLQIAELAEAPNEKLIRILKRARTRYADSAVQVDDEQADTEKVDPDDPHSPVTIPFRSCPADLPSADPAQPTSADTVAQWRTATEDRSSSLGKLQDAPDVPQHEITSARVPMLA